MQIGYYTHQYIKKVCRGELPFDASIRASIAFIIEKRLRNSDFFRNNSFLFSLSVNFESIYLQPKWLMCGSDYHCIIQQKEPIYYWLFGDVAVGIKLEKLVEIMLQTEKDTHHNAALTHVFRLYFEHLKWMLCEKGIKTAGFPRYRNAFYRYINKEQIYAIINQVLTYKLKHNG